MRACRFFLFTLLFILSSLYAASHDTPDYWQCNNRSGGSWIFGRAPSVCDLDQFIPKDFVLDTYKDHIFNDQVEAKGERARYMGEMYSALTKLASWYIEKRKPLVKDAERMGFVRTALSIAHQESYWSHYRLTKSGRLQMMRGDYGHGHGLFQVDDRWHYNAVIEGRAANMIMNGVYSLDEYYAAWVKSAKAWCITSESDYYNRARAAYSAYNGGPSRICRWTNPNDKWARNDVGYKAKLDGQSWFSYISDLHQESLLDIDCIAAGGEKCQSSSVDDAQAEGLVAISQFITLSKNINLRRTPGGVKLGVLAAGSVFQVIDISIDSSANFGRYYQVQSESGIGYIYAGDQDSYRDWILEIESSDAEKILFTKGDRIEVASDSGIPFWIEGELSASRIPWGETLVIDSLEVTENKSLFYHTSWNGLAVKIDGGKLGETPILSKDILAYDDQSSPVWARLVDSIFYMNVRAEKSTSSKINGVLSGPRVKLQYFKLLAVEDEWCSVRLAELSGYIKCRYLERVER